MDRPAIFGKNAVRSADAYGDDRLLRFRGQDKPAFLEISDYPVSAPGAFWENEHGGPLPNCLGGPVHAGERFSVIFAVYRDIAYPVHRLTKDHDLKKLLFGQPAKTHRQFPERRENIEPSLVIACKYIGPLAIYIFKTCNGNLYS